MKSKTRPYFLHLLRQYRAFVVLYTLIAMIPYPIALFIRLLIFRRQGLENAAGELTEFVPIWAISTQATLAAVVIGLAMITPYIVFSFLFNRSNLDTYFSLPIKREKLFMKHFLFGWLLVLLPVLLSHLLGFGIIRIFTALAIAEGAAVKVTYLFGPFLLNSLYLALGSLFFIMPTTLAILYTPNLFNAIIYGGVFHLLPNILAMTVDLFTKHYTGYTQLSRQRELSPLSVHENFLRSFEELNRLNNPLYVPILFLLGLALLGLAVRLFCRRQSERTNGVDMVKGFFPFIISFFGLLILTSFFSGNFTEIFSDSHWYLNSLFIFALTGGFALYLTVQIIRRHGMPHIGKTVLSYVIIFLVSLGLTFGLRFMLRELVVLRTPDPASVASVEVASGQITYKPSAYLIESGKFGYYYPFGSDVRIEKVTLDEPQKIKGVIGWQKDHLAMLEASDELNNSDNLYSRPNVRLVYYDAGGHVLMARCYDIRNEQERQQIEAISGLKLLEPEDDTHYEYSDEALIPAASNTEP